ncbi:MAG: tetratricopeptide repeat protein [Gammaproteobacteria bacterium]|nr:tetratricopeptide repeat protein [Gammaproteobacteria bacterium]
MNDIVLNDDEKVEQIKQWWKRYGNLIITVIIIALLAIVGWQYWQRHQQKIAAQASTTYDAVLVALSRHEQAALQGNVNQLQQDYRTTPYAAFATLLLAGDVVNQGDLVQAEKQLRWVIANSAQTTLVELAQIRLARLLLTKNQPQPALTLLNTISSRVYPVQVAMIKGQVLTKLAKLSEARVAYTQALKALPENASIKSMLQALLNDIPQ